MRITSSPRFWILNLAVSGIVGLIFVTGWMIDSNFKRVREQENAVEQTHAVLRELDGVISSAKDVETGLRGYLLTRQENFLEPYHLGMSEIWEHMSRLRAVRAHDQTQSDLLLALEKNLIARLEIIQQALKIAQQPKTDSKTSTLILGWMNEGKVAMDTLRSQVRIMRENELRMLEDRTELSNQSAIAFRWSLLVALSVNVITLIGAFMMMRRNQANQFKKANETALESWKKNHLAQLAQIVAGDVTSDQATKRVLAYLAEHFQVLTANFYVNHDKGLKKAASYAPASATTPNQAPVQLSQGQGLLGESLQRKDVWEISQIPEDYLWISSSLGSSRPRSLVFLPIVFQGRTLGMIESAHFEKLDEETRKLFSDMRETIGIGLNAAISRERLQNLLEKTQQQSEELQTQQEELRAGNEELEQQARALESQQQMVLQRNQDLELSRRDVELKAAELEKANQYKSDFLAKMSHELRTPLNSLLILSTLLIENKEKNFSAKQAEYAKSIHDSGSDLLNLITDILDLSKIEARKISLHPEEFDLPELMEQMKRSFEPQTQIKGLQLKLKISDEIRAARFFTDRQRLEQILRNFLSNALKFTEKGHILIEAKAGSKKDHVQFTVEDSGIGIPTNKRELIFRAFEQADGSVSRKYGGTGLGLTISRELAHLLGGEITLQSEEGRGSRFTIEIPLNAPKQVENTEHLSPTVSPTAPNGRFAGASRAIPAGGRQEDSKTILIATEDAAFRRVLSTSARNYGFQTVEAPNALAAVQMLESHIPRAILLDDRLTSTAGTKLSDSIRQMKHLENVPVHAINSADNTAVATVDGELTQPRIMADVQLILDQIGRISTEKIKRLLIIEDDPQQAKAITELIGPSDELNVISVATGQQALVAIRENKFDCITLDLGLPDLSGLELLDRMKAGGVVIPPVVIYTARDLSPQEEDRLRSYSEHIIIKGSKSSERLLDEVNLFLHRVETLNPEISLIKDPLQSQKATFDDRTVLLVDDDVRNIFALTSALESKGIHVQIARDGFEAIEVLRKNKRIDLVLMDFMMPKMDGLEATRRIRAQTEYKDLPIIMLTAKAMKGDHEKCIDAGANDYLPKPVNLMHLLSVLQVWLAPKIGFAND